MAKRRARQLAGAGGDWIVIDERPDPSVIAQIGETHCCAACAAMILQDRGILLTQEKIALALGVPTSLARLAEFLNQVDAGHLWKFGYIHAGLETLHDLAPWIALLKDVDNHLLHAVVVDGIEGRHFRIRDPSGVGTTYRMAFQDFQTEHHGWTGAAVFARPIPRKMKETGRRKW